MSTGSLAVTTALEPTRAKAGRREFLSARWHLLAMLNWEIDPRLLEPLVPRGTRKLVAPQLKCTPGGARRASGGPAPQRLRREGG